MRQLFADKLKAAGGPDWSYLVGQRGMFSFTPITKAQVDQLREEYAIYIVGSGRINVAGITEANVDRLCECLVKVLG
jgi:aspartate aminotransferase